MLIISDIRIFTFVHSNKNIYHVEKKFVYIFSTWCNLLIINDAVDM